MGGGVRGGVPEECGRAVSSCVVKPEGSAAPAPILTSVDMPEGEMARAAMKRSWRSGCGCAAGSVLTKPPWSHATDVSGPRLRRSHCSRASGLGFVDRGSLVRESERRRFFVFLNYILDIWQKWGCDI